MLNKILHFGLCLIVLCLPLYLLRLKIWWIPTTVLELMIYAVFVLWLVKRVIVRATEYSTHLSAQESRTLKSKFNFSTSSNSKFCLYPIFLIFLGATISTLFSSNLQVSAGLWKAYFLDPLLFLIVFIDTIKTKKQVKDIIAALSLSGLAVAIVGLWYWFNGELTYDGRLRTFYLSPNHLAMYIAPALLFFTYFLLTWPKKKNVKYLFLIFCLLPFAFCLFKTYSYGAWLGVISGLIFLFLSLRALAKQSRGIPRDCFGLRPRNDRAKRIVLFLVMLLLLILVLTQFQTQKFQDFLSSSHSPWQSRLIIWQVAGEIIKDHPLIGIGPGLFQKYYLDYQPRFEPYLEWAVPQPHNIFFAFWLQTSLLGLIGFIWLLVVFFRKILQGLSLEAPPRTVLGAVMIYILIHGLVDTPFWKNDLAMIFWLIIGLSLMSSLRPKLFST